ncbi:MAG: methyltransferase [Anaerolineales bacterium]|nr:methyltransferase [Anaerolineales bacterium]
MADFDFLQPFVNKRVQFRFSRQELRFDLSQSLFSSFDIDAGSRLLLKTVATQLDMASFGSALDVGCGVGVLGLSVKKVNPQIELVLQDRDALAVAFAARNARLNKLRDVVVQGGLAFQAVAGRRFDLILCNLPGKAGEPVLASLLAQMPLHLTAAGIAAVVVVKPLAEMVAGALQQQGSEVTYREMGQGYAVFHFHGGTAVSPDAPLTLTPYLRAQPDFTIAKKSFALQTVHNVPEFDSVGYYTTLAASMLNGERVNGRVLFWNPGQGHLPVYLRLASGREITHYTLAGRDALSLQISAQNLETYGVPAAQIQQLHTSDFLQLPDEQYDWIILFPDVDAGVPWTQTLLPGSERLLLPGGKLLVTAKSTYVFRMLEKEQPFVKRQDRKKQGYRALLLSRHPQANL